MNESLKYQTVDTIDLDGGYNFFYDFIQGNLIEYRLSEGEEESYFIDDSWRRRLDATLHRSMKERDQVGKFNQYLLSIFTNMIIIEIKKIVSSMFREEVEKTEQEVLLFLISEDCDFGQEFVDKNIINDFAKTVKYSPNFKIMIMDAKKNDLPEEYALYTIPQIMFTGKEKETYRPKTWKNKKYDLDDLRKFLYKHSEEFKYIDRKNKK